MILPAILHYCKYQERCHSEVRRKLFDLVSDKESADEQLAELIAADVLNEERYARAFARGRWRLKKWGRNKIVRELRAKSVSEFCIKAGLSEIDGDEYMAVLEQLAEKKLKELKSEKNIFIRKAKIYRYLAQKGYESDLVNDTLKALFAKDK